MNIVANWLHKDEIELYNIQRIFKWEEFDWNAMKLKIEIGWPMTNLNENYKIDFDIFVFQPSKDEIKDSVRHINLKKKRMKMNEK